MKQNIYIELDALLDTRISTLIDMDESAGLALLGNNYRNRSVDDWHSLNPVFDNEAFAKRYAQRNTHTLKNARPTGMIVSLVHILNNLERDSITTPFVEQLTLTVNTYPYTLSDAEAEGLLEALIYYTPQITQIVLEHLPPKSITPKHIDDHYSVVILYDLDNWLTLHLETLKDHKIPTVTLMAPALYHAKEPDKSELVLPEVGEVNAFALFEYALVEWISLVFTDPKYFSIIEL